MPASSRASAENAGAAARDRGGALPAELTSFVGRRRETSEVKRLLGEFRLVTLTGLGGVGKTRLSQRVAAEVRRSFADGVWFIDLSAVQDPAHVARDGADPDLLAQLVAFELGAWKRPQLAPLGLLTDHLGDRRVLLVLDNCEHLLPACAVLAHSLLRACPQLRILATSREPLGLLGESRFVVPPLSTPIDGLLDGEPAAYDAVTLFLARAQATQPDFRLTQGNQAAVAELCHRAEGLPLALELAAAALPVLSPEQILDRLNDRFRLLRRGSRGRPERQQTLDACVEWSYELCSELERLLWARLTVFAGGCELDAIEGICTDDQLPAADLLNALAGLVNKSIITRDDHGETTRFRMLETLRDYGRDKLVGSGTHDLMRRHRDWHQQLVHSARADWVSDRQEYWYGRLRRAHPNLRAAVDYCLTEPGEAENALQIVVDLPWLYWWGRRLFTEGRRWLDSALGQVAEPSATIAHALLLNSRLAFAEGDAEAGKRLLEQGEQLAHQLGDPHARAHVAYARGLGALYGGEPATAVSLLDQARTLLADVTEPDLDLKVHVLLHLAVAAGLSGDDDELTDTCREEIVEITHNGYAFRQLLWAYALVDWSQGRLQEAVEHEREYLRIRLQQGLDDRSGSAVSLEVLAWVAARQRQHRRAATLLGAADALFKDTGASIDAYQHLVGFHRDCRRQIRKAIGETAFTEFYDRGRALTYEEALAEALDERAPVTPSSPPDRQAASPLTRREQEVARLVAQGLRNKEIAATLVISQRTAETHIENILTKLGFTSRTQIAVWLDPQPQDPSH